MHALKKVLCVVLVASVFSLVSPELCCATNNPTWSFAATNGYSIILVDRSAVGNLVGDEVAKFDATITSPSLETMTMAISLSETDGRQVLMATIDGGVSVGLAGPSLLDDTVNMIFSDPGDKSSIQVAFPLTELQNETNISRIQQTTLMSIFDAARGSRSAAFGSGAISALTEMQASSPPNADFLGGLDCIIAVASYIYSFLALSSCTLVWPCVGAIFFHYASIYAAIRSCMAAGSGGW